MDNRTYRINVNGYSGTVDRVNKTTARQIFDKGRTVFLLAVNLMPGYMWQPCPVKYDKMKRWSGPTNSTDIAIILSIITVVLRPDIIRHSTC